MDAQQIMETLRGICADVFDAPDLVIERGTRADDVDAWDSLTHVHLLAAVEAAFDVRFTLNEMHELKNLGEMVDLVHELVNE